MENVLPRVAIAGLALFCGVALWFLSSTAASVTGGAALDSVENERTSQAGSTDSIVLAAAASRTAGDPAERSSLVVREGVWATVEVQVADRDGPVAGAIVRPHQKFQARPIQPTEGATDGPDFLTGPDGRITLEVAPWTQNTITVTRPGLEWGQERTWRSPAAKKHDTLKIRLLLGREQLKLQVLSFPGGAAMAGAKVAVGSASTLTVPLGLNRSETDENGVVLIPTTPEGASDRYRVSVAAQHHARGSLSLGAPDTDGRQTIWLKRNATLRGSVVVPTTGAEPSKGSTTLNLVPASSVQGFVQGRGEPPLSDSWIDAKDPTTDGPSYSAKGSSTTALSDGTWSIPGIQFADGIDELKDQVLITRHNGVARILARDIHLTPGDVVIIEDPWTGSPPLELAFLLEAGRPAAELGKVVLVREDPTGAGARTAEDNAIVTSGVVGSDGTLRFSSLPKGRWRWEARSHAPLADVGGVIDHDGAPGPKTVRLTGYSSLRGRIVDPTDRDRPAEALVDPADPLLPRPRPRRIVHWRVAGDSGVLGSIFTNVDWEFFLPLIPAGQSIQITHGNARGEAVRFEGRQSTTVAVGTEERNDIVLEVKEAPSFNVTLDPWMRSR